MRSSGEAVVLGGVSKTPVLLTPPPEGRCDEGCSVGTARLPHSISPRRDGLGEAFGVRRLTKTFTVSHTHPLGQALKSVARLISYALPPQSLITTTGGGAVSGIETPTDARLQIGQQGCGARPMETCTWTQSTYRGQVADDLFQAAALSEVMSHAMAGVGRVSYRGGGS